MRGFFIITSLLLSSCVSTPEVKTVDCLDLQKEFAKGVRGNENLLFISAEDALQHWVIMTDHATKERTRAMLFLPEKLAKEDEKLPDYMVAKTCTMNATDYKAVLVDYSKVQEKTK